jgi:hypothetical protein
MLVTQSEKTSTAATKMSFYYPAFYDKVAQYKFDGSVERNNVSFGNVILITYDLGNGYTFGATCTARPGNYMFSYSSTFDPGISQSPTTMSSRQFDWTRFAVSDFTYFPNDLIGSGRLPISNGGMSLNKETGKAFSSLNTDWVQFRLK